MKKTRKEMLKQQIETNSMLYCILTFNLHYVSCLVSSL